ncbi:MAG: hypothetical protein GX660_15020 [Clostridiaceae bacterium]|nr:hypothetical protein [Clostridiaceae bacterium]
MKYCGMSCQNKAKMKRYNDQIKTVQEMNKDGLTPAQIAKETGKSLEQIEKWLAMGKE